MEREFIVLMRTVTLSAEEKMLPKRFNLGENQIEIVFMSVLLRNEARVPKCSQELTKEKIKKKK